MESARNKEDFSNLRICFIVVWSAVLEFARIGATVEVGITFERNFSFTKGWQEFRMKEVAKDLKLKPLTQACGQDNSTELD